MKAVNPNSLFIRATRAYSLPMSFMAWLIPFTFGLTNHGNIYHGILALFGIAFAHLGANMFDDYIDFRRHLKTKNPLQKGKCDYLINNEISLRMFLIYIALIFTAATAVGIYFIYLYKIPIVILMFITGLLCLIYPKSSYFGTGELIIGTIFSPLAFTGVYYVMCQGLSKELLLLSIPFGVMVVGLLYTHSFMDYNYDKTDGKKTLCILCGNKNNAYTLLALMFFLAYFTIFVGTALKILPPIYCITFLSIFSAKSLLDTLKIYINKEPQNTEEFMGVFNKAQLLTVSFTILIVLSRFIN